MSAPTYVWQVDVYWHRLHDSARAHARGVMLCRRVPLGNTSALLTLSPAPNWLALHRARLSVADSPLPGSDPESESSPSSSSSSPSSLSSASVSSVLSRLAALPYSPSSRWPASSGVDMLGGGSGGRSDSVCSWSLWYVHAEKDPLVPVSSHGSFPRMRLSLSSASDFLYICPAQCLLLLVKLVLRLADTACHWSESSRQPTGSLQAMQRSAWRARRGMVGNIQCRERQTGNHRGLGKQREGEREHRCGSAASWKEKSSLSSVMPGLPRNMVGFRKTAHYVFMHMHMFLISLHYIYIQTGKRSTLTRM